jgi:hypothetical protein
MTWYKNAVFYEVHVKAFMDADGNGVGDFAGLTGKLDYVRDLGVDCLWILPMYPSPLRDDGYDIADFGAVRSGVAVPRLLRVESERSAIPGRPDHLHRHREVELDVGSRGQAILLASILQPPAGPEL